MVVHCTALLGYSIDDDDDDLLRRYVITSQWKNYIQIAINLSDLSQEIELARSLAGVVRSRYCKGGYLSFCPFVCHTRSHA